MLSDPRRVHSIWQFCIFVDKPGLAKYVCSCIFHLVNVGWLRFRHDKITRFVNCVSIIKLWTCFSAFVSSSFRATTATTSAVQAAPLKIPHFIATFVKCVNPRCKFLPWCLSLNKLPSRSKYSAPCLRNQLTRMWSKLATSQRGSLKLTRGCHDIWIF